MRKIFLNMNKNYVIVFILFYQLCNGQTINDLDNKNGFRFFKFGSSSSQIKNIIKDKDQHSKNPKVISYTYNGSEIKTVANVEVEWISLTFFEDRLYNVGVHFGDGKDKKEFSDRDYNFVKQALEYSYGKYSGKITMNDYDVIDGLVWNGKKIRLDLKYVNFYKNDAVNSFKRGYIVIYDKEISKLKYSSEF